MSGIFQFGLSVVIYIFHVLADNNIKFTMTTFHISACLFLFPELFFPTLFPPNVWSSSNYYPAFSLLDSILVIVVIPIPSCDHFSSRSCIYFHLICLIFLLSPFMRSLFSDLCSHFWSLICFLQSTLKFSCVTHSWYSRPLVHFQCLFNFGSYLYPAVGLQLSFFQTSLMS